MDGRTSDPLPANFTETSTNGNMKLSPSQPQELLLYFFFSHAFRTRRSPAIRQCLQRVGLLSTFSRAFRA